MSSTSLSSVASIHVYVLKDKDTSHIYGVYSDFMLARQALITLTHQGQYASLDAIEIDKTYWNKQHKPPSIYNNWDSLYVSHIKPLLPTHD